MFNISPVIAIWIAWFATAANLVIGKAAVPYVTSALFLLLACLAAGVFFLPYLLKNNNWKILTQKDVWPRCLAMGTFGTALPMTVFMIALNYTTPVNGAILNQFEIIYSLIMSYLILKERPTLRQMGGSVLIILGVGLLLWQAGISLQLKGDLMIISCLWMFQLSHIFAKKLPAHMEAQLISAARALFAVPALAVLVAYLAVFQGPLMFESNATLWSMLILCAFANYFLGNTYWYRAIRNMDLSKATAIILSYPVMTFILSVCLGQDTISIYKVLGMILAVGGAYVVTGIVKQQGEKK
ncbi:MAG: DMT family transporter [Elusimicrobia bacterium]|nr:DMT family transporter [Elusimicrobiota bacterium]